jgi:WD40 repeat protein
VLKPTEDADVTPQPPIQLGSGPVEATPKPFVITRQRRGTISIAFSPDGKTLATLETDGDVGLWDLSRSEPVIQFRLKVPSREQDRPDGAIYGLRDLANVTFSPDGRMLAAAQPEGWIRLWDLKDGKPTVRAAFPAHEGPVTGVLSFGPTGTTLFSGGGDHLVRTWDVTADKPREMLEPKGPIGGLGGVAFSPDGMKLAVSDAQFVRIWDLSDTSSLSRLPAPKIKIDVGPTDDGPIGSLTFRPIGKTLICGGDLNTSPSMWDVSGLERTRLGDLHSPAFEGIRSMSFSADGETLAAGYNDNKVRVWDMRRLEPKQRLVADGDGQWTPVAAISPDGAHLAFSGPGHSIRLWVLAGLEPRERAVIEGAGWPVFSVAFSPNGKIVAAGTNNGGTQLWDVSGARPRTMHPTPDLLGSSTAHPINDCRGFSLFFSNDGKRLIAADQIFDKAGRLASRPAVCVYDVASGDRLHAWDLSAPCWEIALAPDGRHVAAPQQDGVTLILRLPDEPVR